MQAPRNLDKSMERLNPQQLESVENIEGPLLIVAGAGSGKTSVITTRIAQMLSLRIPQNSILALTFTNKAAREMSERIRTISARKLSNLTISTFHAFGYTIIRERHTQFSLNPNITIYDSADKLTCLRKAATELKQDYEPGEFVNIASLISEIMCRRSIWNETNREHLKIYTEYQEMKQLHNALDFDDLIIRPLDLFESSPETLRDYQNRFKYIMVDEFQDTSAVQYQLIRLLAEKNRNICCVGDDDQSIYSWRGANYSNITNFEKDFPELKEIKLERNYRSGSTILEAANAIIKNNTERKSKNLWTESRETENPIRFVQPENEKEEASFVASTIAALRIEQRIEYQNIGILVRTNSLSLHIENALLAQNIPYTVSGGTSFFQRQEIKDIIAYLRIIDNPNDNISLLRIINNPRRGIGKSGIRLITATARIHNCSLYSAVDHLLSHAEYIPGTQAKVGLMTIFNLTENFRRAMVEDHSETSLAENCRELIEEINYWQHLLTEYSHNEKMAKWRYDNILIFLEMLGKWESHPENLNPALNRWLNRIALNSRDEISDSKSGKVNLTTIHCAKGLEFDAVFLCGAEEGIMPHARSLEENPNSIEEERRLFYVAITRARTQLYISSCRNRKVRLSTVPCLPSPFLNEIPQDSLEHIDTSQSMPDIEDISSFFEKMPWNLN